MLDIATANQSDDTVSILTGDGAGSFLPPIDFAVGAGPVAITTGNFNGDNLLDLATADYFGGTVSILIGTSAGN